MNRYVKATTLVLALAGLSACANDSTAPKAATGKPSAAVVGANAGSYLVSFTSNKPASFEAKVAGLGGAVEWSHAGAGLAVVSGLSAASAAELAQTSGVGQVEADAVVSLQTTASPAEEAASVGVESVANPALAIAYARQWNIRAIGAPAAWAAGKLGSATTRVAILDTGVDYSTPDLTGHIDFASSTSFVASDNALITTYRPGRLPIADLNGHGTNVASIVTTNGAAFAGVTSKVTILAVKVLSAQGSGSTSGVLNGVLWAADHGADVVNMSLGGEFAKAGNGRLVGIINQVFNYASRQGSLIVVAAGNDAVDLNHNGNVFSAYCDAPHVLCVSATGPTTKNPLSVNGPWTNIDAPAFYTNFGKTSISVAAPGGNGPPAGPSNLISFVYSYCSRDLTAFTSTGAVAGFPCAAGNFVIGYAGTSQASPHAAGLAALLVDEIGHGDPKGLKRAIEKSSDDLGPNGKDAFYGNGRINVKSALGL